MRTNSVGFMYPTMARIFFLAIPTFFVCVLCALADERKVYIAYMGALPENTFLLEDIHLSILQDVLENGLPSDAIIRSYKRSFNGFAANLTEKERIKLESLEGIISVFPSIEYKLLTTGSWDFVGLTEDVKRVPQIESDVIIGFLDTGIWPESDSFSDDGIGPVPKKWKGGCNGGQNFTCNKKIIGARYYSSIPGARDTVGHGSHTASTAAGRQVNNVSFYGLAHGNAKGGVPSARLAVYSVCTAKGCQSSDVLAAFDDAISDGVDILSVSLGPENSVPYFNDPIAIGSFHAARSGILVSQSAGNNGPIIGSAGSLAPWILSVAASSTDRKLINKVVLGDNTTFVGRAVNAFNSTKNHDLSSVNFESHKEDGKIVFYNKMYTKGEEDIAENASGIIVSYSPDEGYSIVFPLPASLLSYKDSEKVQSYVDRVRKPKARILKSETHRDSSAPVVLSFSSRGPNKNSLHILKPDITAPGANILAAWSPLASPTDTIGDTRSVKYSFLSGTSMACPHATGAAAYVKSFHPDWSATAIKSALMTTAYPLNATANPDGELAYGAGHIDPVKAIDPGLVYEAGENDYLKFLCGLLPSRQVRSITGDDNSTCPEHTFLAKDLNYPSLATELGDTNFTRTVTNVGAASSTYKATIVSPPHWKIKVEPNILSFKTLNEKKTFVVTVSTPTHQDGLISSGTLIWSDGLHNVRSPIVVISKMIDRGGKRVGTRFHMW